MSTQYGRRVSIALKYSGSIGGKKLAERLSEYTYTDPATGESDVCSLKFFNADQELMKKTPKRGDRFDVAIMLTDWNKDGTVDVIEQGTFCCDDKTYKGWPLDCTIQGTSIPEKQAFHVQARSRTWEYITISEAAGEICGRYGLTLVYDGPDVMIEAVEQSEETDSAFLKKLCESYGLNIKVYSGKVAIYDAVIYEKKPAAYRVKLQDCSSWTYNTTMVGVYTGATIQYTEGENNDEYTVQVGGGPRILNVSEHVKSLEEAVLKAAAKVNKENRGEETFRCTIPGQPGLYSGRCFKLVGAPEIAGKYFIDRLSHRITASGAYTIDIEAHKVQKAVMAYGVADDDDDDDDYSYDFEESDEDAAERNRAFSDPSNMGLSLEEYERNRGFFKPIFVPELDLDEWTH